MGFPLRELSVLHIFFSFPKRGPHKLPTRSWTLAGDTWLTPNSMTQIIFEVRLCYFTGPPLGPLLGLVSFVLPLLRWLGTLLGSICPPPGIYLMCLVSYIHI